MGKEEAAKPASKDSVQPLQQPALPARLPETGQKEMPDAEKLKPLGIRSIADFNKHSH